MLAGLMARCATPPRMRFGERVHELDGDIERASDVQRPAADHFSQWLARHVLEHEKQVRVFFTDFEQRGDIRMRQRRRGPLVLQKLCPALRIGGDRSRDNFKDYGAAKNGVTRTEDITHAPRAKLTENLVMAERVNHDSALAVLSPRYWPCVNGYFLGFVGLISTRLGKLRPGCESKSITTWATSAGESFQTALESDSGPPNFVSTEPGMMELTRMSS